jgi:hypothetical protein
MAFVRARLAVPLIAFIFPAVARAEPPLPPLPPVAVEAPPPVAPPLPPAPPSTAPVAPLPPPNQWRPIVAPPPSPPPTERRWYGHQTLIVDGLSLSFIALGIRNTPQLAEVGLAGFLFGAPTVHWAHGHVGKGFGSLALRLVPPIVALYLLIDGSNGFSDSGSSRTNGAEVAVGAIVGLAWIPTAVTVDAAVLARETVPVEAQKVSWTPRFSLTRGGATVGAGGAF